MTHALPMILPQVTNKQRTAKPSGQKAPLQPKEVWAIRVRLQMAQRVRDLALFNLAIDSKLRGCDLVRLRVADVAHMGEARSHARAYATEARFSKGMVEFSGKPSAPRRDWG